MTELLAYQGGRKHRNSCLHARGKHGVFWHSNVAWLIALQPGDHLWIVTSGACLRHEDRHAGFLIGLWTVAEVVENPSDDTTQPRGKFRYRIVADETESITFDDPVLVDHIVRPEGREKTTPIGRFLANPKRLLNEQYVRKLRAAAGHELALRWLTGTRR